MFSELIILTTWITLSQHLHQKCGRKLREKKNIGDKMNMITALVISLLGMETEFRMFVKVITLTAGTITHLKQRMS